MVCVYGRPLTKQPRRAGRLLWTKGKSTTFMWMPGQCATLFPDRNMVCFCCICCCMICL